MLLSANERVYVVLEIFVTSSYESIRTWPRKRMRRSRRRACSSVMRGPGGRCQRRRASGMPAFQTPLPESGGICSSMNADVLRRGQPSCQVRVSESKSLGSHWCNAAVFSVVRRKYLSNTRQFPAILRHQLKVDLNIPKHCSQESAVDMQSLNTYDQAIRIPYLCRGRPTREGDWGPMRRGGLTLMGISMRGSSTL